MFNKNAFNHIKKSNLNQLFKKEDDTYCLSHIPGTILELFGQKSNQSLPHDVLIDKNKTYDKVVLFVIDAFGYSFFEKYYEQSSFLKQVVANGVVSKLTTQFPSTTTANITTLLTGLPVSQSGVIEWFYYEPKIDDVYSPLLYKKAKDETLLEISADEIIPTQNLFSKLKVKSYAFQYNTYNKGPYSHYMQRNCTTVDFNDLEDGLKKLNGILKKKQKAFCYFYHSDFDSICHQFGPNAKETEDCILSILKQFDQFFEENVFDNTLFIITADHGQTSVDKKQAVYINLQYPEILPFLKKNKKGKFLIPCGSFRDMFLHVKKDAIEFVYQYLKEKLRKKAEVYKIEQLIDLGVFGHNQPSKTFLERIGDIAILAYKDQAIWWYEENKFYVKHEGMHGGLTKEEMEIPFLVYQQ